MFERKQNCQRIRQIFLISINNNEKKNLLMILSQSRFHTKFTLENTTQALYLHSYILSVRAGEKKNHGKKWLNKLLYHQTIMTICKVVSEPLGQSWKSADKNVNLRFHVQVKSLKSNLFSWFLFFVGFFSKNCLLLQAWHDIQLRVVWHTWWQNE